LFFSGLRPAKKSVAFLCPVVYYLYQGYQRMKLLNYSGYFCTAAIALFSAFFLASAARYILVVPPLTSVDIKPLRADEAAEKEKLALAVAERNIFDIDRSAPIPTNSPGAAGGSGGGTAGNAALFDGKLTGIFVGTDGKDTRAIILKNNKDVLVLKQGLPLEGYTLNGIDGEKALLNYNGTDFTIELQDSGLTSAPAAPAVSAPPARAQPFRPQTAAPPVTEGTENITLNRNELTGQLKDINKVISTLLASPTYMDKELVGYRIVRMQNESPVRQLGILPGDVINRINGEELTNPQILFNMLQQAADISAISVDITRDGVKKTLFVEIQ
jgi:general secretion pathway protein C